MTELRYRVPSLAVVVDTSAILGYTVRRRGVVDLLHSLDGDRFVLPILCLGRAMRLAPTYAPGPRILDPQRIADHPWCVQLPVPAERAELVTGAAVYWDGRADLAAAYVLADHLRCSLATYEPDSYLLDGKLPEWVLPLEDGWR